MIEKYFGEGEFYLSGVCDKVIINGFCKKGCACVAWMNVIGEEILGVSLCDIVDVDKLVALFLGDGANDVGNFLYDCGIDVIVCKTFCHTVGIKCCRGSAKDDSDVGVIRLILGEALKILLTEGVCTTPILGL